MKLLLPLFILLSLSLFSQSKKELNYQLSQKEKELEEQKLIRLELEEKLAKTEKKLRYKKEQFRIIDKELIWLYDVINNPYATIDNHVRLCPKSIKEDADALVEYFEEVTETDIEKARAIYVWLTDNIGYDVYSINNDKYGDNSAAGVLRSKKSVCAGFAALYEYLGLKMGLDIRQVSGFSKGVGYEPGMSFIGTDSDHAWNMIKIDGEWRVFDATWGEGHGKLDNNGKLHSIKEFDDNWFNISPEEAIFTHYPEDKSLLLLESNISLEDFGRLPNIYIGAFRSKLLKAEDVLGDYITKVQTKYPVIYTPHALVNVVQAPKTKTLTKGQAYVFDIYAPKALNIYLYDDDGPRRVFKRNLDKTSFAIQYVPKIEGQLRISIEWQNSYGNLRFLEYEVK